MYRKYKEGINKLRYNTNIELLKFLTLEILFYFYEPALLYFVQDNVRYNPFATMTRLDWAWTYFDNDNIYLRGERCV